MATFILMSHHAFRRDLARFATALADPQPARAAALREEWAFYRNALHGHHEKEDQDIFPHVRGEHPDLASILAQLSSDHAKIDPLLERGDRAFAAEPGDAAAVIAELTTLLDDHLDREEASIVPLLRGANQFPEPATDADAELYADGFAWSLTGIAENVVEQVQRLLPESLTSRLPAARARFHERCERVFGPARPSASTTSIPDLT